jgi:cell division protein YceG involved in septum cleavage
LFAIGFGKSDGSDKHKDKPKDEKDKTQTAVIVVCVLIITFIIGIVAFFAYRNKDRYNHTVFEIKKNAFLRQIKRNKSFTKTIQLQLIKSFF